MKRSRAKAASSTGCWRITVKLRMKKQLEEAKRNPTEKESEKQQDLDDDEDLGIESERPRKRAKTKNDDDEEDDEDEDDKEKENLKVPCSKSSNAKNTRTVLGDMRLQPVGEKNTEIQAMRAKGQLNKKLQAKDNDEISRLKRR